MPDISIVTPVFYEGAPRFFTANIAHHSDVGGSVPGSISGAARSIFEEGIRIPAIKIVRQGVLDRDLLRLISSNSRDPTERTLDLQVQVSTNERGATMVRDLIARMGIDLVEQSIEDLLIYTRERLTARLAAVGDMRLSARSWMDDDGMPGDPVAICATVSKRDGKLLIDFAGSAPQARGAMNIPQSALRAAVYFSVKTLLDPDLPPNSGFFDAIEIAAPEGTIVNPKPPAAVGARSIGCNKVVRAIFNAFADMLPPDRKLAPGHDAVPAIVFSGDHKSRPGQFVYLETMGGGLGASATADGMDSIQVHMTNTSNLPIEALEHEYPLVVDEYAMVPDSGGAGQYRGGLGLARQIRTTVDGVVFSARSDNHVIAPSGMEGGQPGRTAHLIWNHGQADTRELSSKVSALPLRVGDSLRLETAGGGGFGKTAKRPGPLLADDLRSGKISHAEAVKTYGADAPAQALRNNQRRMRD
jgi:N-methylhydantoinase B